MDRRFFISAIGAMAATPALSGGHGRIGMFHGVNGHISSGSVEIAGDAVNLLGDFVFDGAPDPKVALGRNGIFDPATVMASLASNSGASSYEIPPGIEGGDYNEVWIWCEQFNVGLAVATIG